MVVSAVCSVVYRVVVTLFARTVPQPAPLMDIVSFTTITAEGDGIGWQITVLDAKTRVVNVELGCTGISSGFTQETPATCAFVSCWRASSKECIVNVHSISSSSSPRQTTPLAWMGLSGFP